MRSTITRSLLTAALVFGVALSAAPASQAACSNVFIGKHVGTNGGQIYIYRNCATNYYFATLSNGSYGDSVRLKLSSNVFGIWANANSAGSATTGKLYTAGTMCAESRRNTIGGLVIRTYCY